MAWQFSAGVQVNAVHHPHTLHSTEYYSHATLFACATPFSDPASSVVGRARQCRLACN